VLAHYALRDPKKAMQSEIEYKEAYEQIMKDRKARQAAAST
jgi:hypothetical protein